MRAPCAGTPAAIVYNEWQRAAVGASRMVLACYYLLLTYLLWVVTRFTSSGLWKPRLSRRTPWKSQEPAFHWKTLVMR